jgi:hypothetical protein
VSRDKILLALAYEFSEAPDEVKVSAAELRDIYLKAEQSSHQAKLWADEARELNAALARASNRFDKAIRAWDPAGTKDKTLKVKGE